MKNRFTPAIRSATIATALLFTTAFSTHATTIFVTNTNDSGSGSLRAALAAANDGDTIDASGVSGTILLTSAELQVTHNVTINGPGAASLAVNGNATFRVFETFASNVTIAGLTITNGLADGNGGGGILNHGVLTVTNSIVSNSASLVGNNNGGGINNASATLTVTDSIISGNSAGGDGGGIFSTNAHLTVTNSTISDNSAGTGGGIFYNGGGTLTVMNSTISGNSAGDGGGMGSGLQGTTTAMVTDSTISGNSASTRGGGIFNYPQTLTVINSTISGNSTGGDGGGIWNGGNPGNLTVTSSTISGNNST